MKTVGKILKVTGIVLLSLLVLLVGVGAIVLSSSGVQTSIVHLLTESLERSLSAEVEIGKVSYRMPNHAEVDKIFIADQQGDTLLYSECVIADFRLWELVRGHVDFTGIELRKTKLYVSRSSSDTLNCQFLLDRLPKERRKPLDLKIKDIYLNDACVSYTDYKKLSERTERWQEGRLDPADVRIDSLNTMLSLNRLSGDSMDVEIKHLFLREKSGLEVDDIEMRVVVTPTEAYMPKMHIRLPHSDIATGVVHTYLPGRENLSDSIGRIKTDMHIDHADLVMRDLAALVPTMGQLDGKLSFSASCEGSVDSLHLSGLSLAYRQQSIIEGDVSLRGLPDIDSLLFNARLSKLYLTNALVEDILSDLNDKVVHAPAILNRLGYINYRGRLSGSINSMELKGLMKTGRGQITTDARLNSQKKIYTRIESTDDESASDTITTTKLFGDVDFTGQVATRDFQLGKLLNIKDMGDVSLNLSVDGHTAGKDHPLHGDIKARVDAFTFRDYTYKNLELDGRYSSRGFEGEMGIDDENVSVDFSGLVDFAQAIPQFRFTLNSHRLRFDRLNLIPSLVNSDLRFSTTIDLEGSGLDQMDGEMQIDTLTFINDEKELKMKSFRLIAEAPTKTNSMRSVKIQSDFLNAGISGQFDYSTLPITLKKMALQYVPRIISDKRLSEISSAQTNNDLNFYAYIRDLSKITDVLNIDMEVEKVPTLKGFVHESDNSILLQAAVEHLRYKKLRMDDLTLDLNNEHDRANLGLYVLTRAGQTHAGELLGDMKLNLKASAYADSLMLSMGYESADNDHHHGELLTLTHFGQEEGTPIITLDFLPTELVLGDTVWQMRPSEIVYDGRDSIADIDNFCLTTGHQTILANGRAGKRESDSLLVDLKDVNLSYLLEYTEIDGAITFGGLVNGWAQIYSLMSSPMFEADARMKDATINSSVMGDAHAVATLDKTNKKVDIVGDVVEAGDTVALVTGEVIPAKNKYWSVDIDVDSVNLAFINYWTSSILDNVEGRGVGHIKVYGYRPSDTDKRVYVVGKACAMPASLGISYLGTRYSFNDTVVLDTASIRFNDITLYDKYNNPVHLNGVVNHHLFQNFSYDVHIDVDNGLAMQLPPSNQDLFYGTVMASGEVDIKGDEKQCNINVNASTRPSTDFYLSVRSVSDASDNSFVEFVSDGAEVKPAVTKKSRRRERRDSREGRGSTKMLVSLQVEVTPEADVTLLVSGSGDQLRGRGAGNLRIDYDEAASDVKMYGGLVLQSGTFDFTLQNIVHRTFSFRQGSEINWTGSAIDPTINASAVYSTTASLRDLFGSDYSNVATTRSSVPVNCILYLTENLSNPTISFGIELPQSDESVASQVKSVINTEEMLMREIIYLLVFNRFYTPEFMQTNSTVGLNETYSVLTNTITGQINNWLSKITNNFTVGFNIRTDGAGAQSSQEYETQFQIQPTSRLLINGNVGYRYNDISNQPVFGNLDVEYKLDPSGQWRARAYTHTVDKYSLRSATTVQGIGLRFQHDFNIGDAKKRAEAKDKVKEEKKKIPIKIGIKKKKRRGKK